MLNFNRLLSTLTRALQSSGVDLSQASISVQVDIGKRANNGQNSHEAAGKVHKTFFSVNIQQNFYWLMHRILDSEPLQNLRLQQYNNNVGTLISTNLKKK